ERGHEAAVGPAIEIFGGAFGGGGKREGMELLAGVDVLIHIFHDIFGKGRSEQAAMGEGAMAELCAALAPGGDFGAVEMPADFFLKLVVAGHVTINDFAVVEDGFDFLRSRIRAKSE